VLLAAAVVFVVGLIGNLLSFSNRFVNALVTAIVFIAIYVGLVFATKAEAPPVPMDFLPADYAWLQPVLIAAVVVFVVDLIGNMLSFSSRFVNAIVSAIVFAVIFGGLTYYAKEQGMAVPTIENPKAAPTPAP
jgi:hypothetical protein